MSDVTNIPRQNAFSTTLTSSIDASETSITLDEALAFAIGAEPVYLVIDPKNNFREVVRVTAGSNPYTVTRGVADYDGGPSTAQVHSGGARVVLTNSWNYYDEYATAINSKADSAGDVFTGPISFSGATNSGIRAANLTTAEREALTGANGMMVYDTTLGEMYQYIGGAWQPVEGGSTQPNATTAVAGKVELPSAAEVLAGTAVGGTGAALAVTPDTLMDTGVSKTSSVGAADAGKIVRLDANGLIDNSFMPYDATEAEIDQALDGISANVTAANLNTMAAGPTSNADAFHTHLNVGVWAGVAGEAINGSVTPQAVCQIGNDFRDTILVHEDGIGLTGTVNLDCTSVAGGVELGEADNDWKQAQSFTYTSDNGTIKLNSVSFFLRKVGAPVDNLSVVIQASTGGDVPDEVTIANGTSGTVAGSTLTTTEHTWVTFTFATPPTLTAGQKYWAVVQRSAFPDAVNHYLVGNTNADRYSGHGRASYTGTTETWTNNGAQDFYFKADFICDGANQVYQADADSPARCNYVGITASNVAKSAALNVKPSGAVETGFSGLSQSVEHFVSQTAGGITATPPSSLGVSMIPVGVTRNATTLEIQRAGQKTFSVKFAPIYLMSAGSVTFDIPCGFKPKEIHIAWDMDDSSGGNTGYTEYHVYRGLDASQALVGFNGSSLSGNTVITAVSAVTAGTRASSSSTIIYPSAYLDNGVTLTVKQAATESIVSANIVMVG